MRFSPSTYVEILLYAESTLNTLFIILSDTYTTKQSLWEVKWPRSREKLSWNSPPHLCTSKIQMLLIQHGSIGSVIIIKATSESLVDSVIADVLPALKRRGIRWICSWRLLTVPQARMLVTWHILHLGAILLIKKRNYSLFFYYFKKVNQQK